MEPQSGEAGGLREELRGDAQTMTDTAKERLHTEVDSRKGAAVNQAQTLSSALGAAANELGPDTPNWLKSLFEQGSQTLQRFSQTIEQKDSRQLTRDIEQLARQNPGTFLAGCALAGFAAARVFKAGASEAGSQAGAGGYAPYQGQGYQGQGYQGQGYAPQSYQDQPYQGQVSQGQGYQGQSGSQLGGGQEAANPYAPTSSTARADDIAGGVV